MKLQKSLLLTSLFLCLIFSVSAQKAEHLKGEILVKMKPNINARTWAKNKQQFRGKKTRLRFRETVSKPMNIYCYTFDADNIDENTMLGSIQSDPMVEVAQFNHRVKLRSTVPNDTQFTNQWQYINNGQNGGTIGADIDADLAWDVTTGGSTIDGDEIVVCIIDGGFQITHPDLAPNIWYNTAEIPNNGIDDDNNGFIDDYKGWNTETNDDDVENGEDPEHGTAVAGIVGAKGNNGIGVTGVNWDIKLMLVSGGTGVESEVLRAYSYALAARKKYNETNGAEGAFVVATSASWGVDFGQATSAPLWCELYDTLGRQGILNAGATVNDDLNVDIVGDLPTNCPSDYLIGVTNIKRNDEKNEYAGYGTTSIDIGAFGEDTWTTAMPTNEFPNSYAAFGGTSAATPHVAGTIALLYSAPCSNFINLAKSNPAIAALEVKKYILNGGDDNASLNGITLTGKRLNVNNSLQLLVNQCDECVAPAYLGSQNVIDTEADLTWELLNTPTSTTLRWRQIGTTDWIEVNNPTNPLKIFGLIACTDYEFQTRNTCNSETSEYSESYIFKTDGCCLNPDNLIPDVITENNMSISWNSILAAQSYNIRLRENGTSIWTTNNTSNTTTNFSNLIACTDYEIQIQTICLGETIAFSPSQIIRTKGCGACTDLTYCPPPFLNSDEEWIKSVTFNTINNASTKERGYADYTGSISTDVILNQSYDITVIPDFSVAPFEDYLKVWIDYNADGDFDDSGEEIFNETEFDETSSRSITIPPTATLGLTRMRVMMSFNEITDACSPTDNKFGEIEDYCVNIIDPTASVSDYYTLFSDLNISPNPFSDKIVIEFSTRESIEVNNIELVNLTGQVLQSKSLNSLSNQNVELKVDNLSNGIYFLIIKTTQGTISRKMVKQ
ncbi:hypothetical protein A8C32_14140 [Flavivirga aquatica]|uniref:Fibronectin type-III domain-containing protein n=1 Tax=Flavivirga aquatica TaxID=1849968 RepID=A0A1E5TCG9_9FLAO|nr:S8 family serine peptidase [Flavivirga aquatica]OEK09027.1 hypothetical protein A8C32_14140 [Flavivirga aquatica]